MFIKENRNIYSSVSEMLDELGWSHVFQRIYETRLILCYEPINGLAENLFEGILIEAYKHPITKQNKTLRQIVHSTNSMVSHFQPKLLVDGTGLLSPKLYHWQHLNINF